MWRYVFIAVCAIALNSTAAEQEEFVCPQGAKDSGYQPGFIVRWCEVGPQERPLYHGPVWRWHRNGQLAAKENYVSGKGDGNWQTWFEDGKPASLGRFITGRKMGRWKYWDPKGWLKTEVEYGESRNQRTDFDASGNKIVEGYFHHGGKLGQWIWRNADGTEKARCDFAKGMLVVTTAGCKLIAQKLEPKGFSKPVATASELTPTNITVTVGNEQFFLTLPSGWKADLVSAAKEKAPLVVVPENGKWRGDVANIYFRLLFRDERSFNAIAAEAFRSIEENVAEFKSRAKGSAKTSRGRRIATWNIQYSESFGTDSPFTIVTRRQIFEKIGIVDFSKSFAVMAVVTAPEEGMLNGSEKAFMTIIQSIRSAD